eukprot:GHVR01052905.1.p1 GENE.GHVR01052905.1~~GHVR01052905.1.p1  ORF type:complete len:116 (+),score=14.12 GHVR01052905.1:213-560(+)
MDFRRHAYPAFDVDGDPTSVAVRWTKWIAKFENYLLLMNIEEVKQQRALLLHFAGDRIYDIFGTISDTGDDFNKAKEALDKYFKPTKNTDYSVYLFRQEMQSADSMDKYATRQGS